MAINIEKRTRAVATDPWGAWALTTDTPPYDNTDLVEYRVVGTADINIEDFTNGAVIDNGDSEDNRYEWQGTGVFDIMMNAVNGNIKVEYDNGRIVGQDYAAVYLGALQSTLANAMKFLFQEPQTELQLDKAREDLALLKDTHDDKVRMTSYQADKILEEKKALVQSVIDNRKIKALDSLADTFGTFGAGGLTLSEDMWTVYFGIVSDLVSELGDYRGAWDADTNTPDLNTVTGMKPGDFYRVSVAGTTDIDGTDNWLVNDIVVYTSGVNGDATNGYWRKSKVYLPSSTTVSKVT